MLTHSGGRTTLVAILMVAAVACGALARTNLMSGEFETEALGHDYAGVSIEDVGGGISWLSFWTSE